MKRFAVAIAALTLAAPARAQTCPLEQAIYTEDQNGYELRFRPLTSQESVGMVTHAFDLVFPGGDPVLAGKISTNMGISRDEGLIEQGCGLADSIADEKGEDPACTIWRGVIYALGDHAAGPVPFPQEEAPPTLLLSDLGRQVRYRGPVSSPGEEPWDVFTLARCGG